MKNWLRVFMMSMLMITAFMIPCFYCIPIAVAEVPIEETYEPTPEPQEEESIDSEKSSSSAMDKTAATYFGWHYRQGLLGTYYDTLESIRVEYPLNIVQTINKSYERLIRIDAQTGDGPGIAFNWGKGSPDSVIEPETFSTNWSGYIQVSETGYYNFYTYSDDGVRLTIGRHPGRYKIINRPGLVNLEFTKSSRVLLVAGLKYQFDMQYQEGPLNSTIFLFWQKDGSGLSLVPANVFCISNFEVNVSSYPQYPSPVKGNGNGLKAEYFEGAEGVAIPGNTPVYTATEAVLYHEWGLSSPDPSVPADDFSARWTGFIEAKYSELVHLKVVSDDGVRMWINGNQVLDEWHPNSGAMFDVPINMVAGELYEVNIEYNEIGLGASCQLFWSSAGQESEVIPSKFLYTDRPSS